MDVVGSEIGQKMRSAIKAKLTELGCYVDDELPDYVMVMVANKRTRAQMEDDLQLFLGDNTELFVNWLHQVLKKLQEVTITPLKTETEKTKEKKSKEKKDKEKTKLKKTESTKKSKKKDKLKEKSKKKEDRKAHKSKKKSKHHGMIRPNVPPLLMNIEKESEPSITDVFAGQILKNHGVLIETTKEEKEIEQKPVIKDIKRPILPIIDPSTITNTPEPTEPAVATEKTTETAEVASQPREEQIKEINEIEAKIQGLKQKLAEQLDSMSDDEDFLNIRTEAEELMNDFAEDVFQEISAQAPVATPPLEPKRNPTPPPIAPKVSEPTPPKEPETLPQIELKLPKRPVRDRLGAPAKKVPEVATKEKEDKRIESPERFTPEREPDFWGKLKPAKQRLGDPPEREPPKRISVSEESEKSDSSTKKLSSKVSSGGRARCASVVRVRPRVRTQPASNLLLRAVADAHKSLLNIPPKVDQEPQMVKRALVLPMRRTVDNQKIVVQIPTDRNSEVDSDDEKQSKSDVDKEEYVPTLTKKIVNTDYVPSRRPERTTSRRDDTLIIETLNIHNPTVGKDKGTQFIVTMDGFNPNAFLAKKLKTEGLLDDDDTSEKPKESTSVLKIAKPVLKTKEIEKTKKKEVETSTKNTKEVEEKSGEVIGEKKRLSDTSDESDTQVIIKNVIMEEASQERAVKRKSTEVQNVQKENESSPTLVKKRKASPIVFDVAKKEKEKKEDSSKKEKEVKDIEAVKEDKKPRERTESVSSDSQVVSTTPKTHKYDSLPSLTTIKPAPAPESGSWCRVFPLCRWGARCVFLHPRCKFAAACTRRGCPYSHARNAPDTPPPQVASHVVPVANYKSISNTLPSICKFYPNCANPACHFYHPKPCRYGPACINKLECNFYHSDVPTKFRYPV